MKSHLSLSIRQLEPGELSYEAFEEFCVFITISSYDMSGSNQPRLSKFKNQIFKLLKMLIEKDSLETHKLISLLNDLNIQTNELIRLNFFADKLPGKIVESFQEVPKKDSSALMTFFKENTPDELFDLLYNKDIESQYARTTGTVKLAIKMKTGHFDSITGSESKEDESLFMESDILESQLKELGGRYENLSEKEALCRKFIEEYKNPKNHYELVLLELASVDLCECLKFSCLNPHDKLETSIALKKIDEAIQLYSKLTLFPPEAIVYDLMFSHNIKAKIYKNANNTQAMLKSYDVVLRFLALPSNGDTTDLNNIYFNIYRNVDLLLEEELLRLSQSKQFEEYRSLLQYQLGYALIYCEDSNEVIEKFQEYIAISYLMEALEFKNENSDSKMLEYFHRAHAEFSKLPEQCFLNNTELMNLLDDADKSFEGFKEEIALKSAIIQIWDAIKKSLVTRLCVLNERYNAKPGIFDFFKQDKILYDKKFIIQQINLLNGLIMSLAEDEAGNVFLPQWKNFKDSILKIDLTTDLANFIADIEKQVSLLNMNVTEPDSEKHKESSLSNRLC